ncbi:MAG: Acetylornithine deacetylase, partial [uncultured Acetobacteraceae bacterium]
GRRSRARRVAPTARRRARGADRLPPRLPPRPLRQSARRHLGGRAAHRRLLGRRGGAMARRLGEGAPAQHRRHLRRRTARPALGAERPHRRLPAARRERLVRRAARRQALRPGRRRHEGGHGRGHRRLRLAARRARRTRGAAHPHRGFRRADRRPVGHALAVRDHARRGARRLLPQRRTLRPQQRPFHGEGHAPPSRHDHRPRRARRLPAPVAQPEQGRGLADRGDGSALPHAGGAVAGGRSARPDHTGSGGGARSRHGAGRGRGGAAHDLQPRGPPRRLEGEPDPARMRFGGRHPHPRRHRPRRGAGRGRRNLRRPRRALRSGGSAQLPRQHGRPGRRDAPHRPGQRRGRDRQAPGAHVLARRLGQPLLALGRRAGLPVRPVARVHGPRRRARHRGGVPRGGPRPPALGLRLPPRGRRPAL